MYPNAGKRAPPGTSSGVVLRGYTATVHDALDTLSWESEHACTHTRMHARPIVSEHYANFFFPLIIHLLFKPHVYIPSQVCLRWERNTGLTFQRGWTPSGYLRSQCGKWSGRFLCLWPWKGRKRKGKFRQKYESFRLQLGWKSSVMMVRLCLIYRKVSHLQIKQDRSDPHCLADLQAVGEEGEARGALVIGWQNFNVDCGDGAPDGKKEWKSVSWQHHLLRGAMFPSIPSLSKKRACRFSDVPWLQWLFTESETFGWTHVRGHEHTKNDILESNNQPV